MLKNHYIDVFKVEAGMTLKEMIGSYKENRLHPIIKSKGKRTKDQTKTYRQHGIVELYDSFCPSRSLRMRQCS